MIIIGIVTRNTDRFIFDDYGIRRHGAGVGLGFPFWWHHITRSHALHISRHYGYKQNILFNTIHQHFKIRTRLYLETRLRKRRIHNTTCFSKEWRGDPFTKTYELSTRDILFINLIYPIRCISHITRMYPPDKLLTP